MTTTNDAAFPYHEPSTTMILILTSFLLQLNVYNHALDRLVFCGLLGQILVGVWYGTPGANWLGDRVELAVQQLGYLGLILLVYEGIIKLYSLRHTQALIILPGGLNTNLKMVRSNALLSTMVATNGIGAPIALSFLLQKLLTFSGVQAFAAGAALCSTSLGTTFTVLSTSGLTESRLGVVLASAAMMDDVVGLVMVQIISALGPDSSSKFTAAIIIRPVLVSLAFIVLIPATCVWVLSPLTIWVLSSRKSDQSNKISKLVSPEQLQFFLQTLLLVGMVTGSTYAGTSNLFAAYLAGATVSWYYGLLESISRAREQVEQSNPAAGQPCPSPNDAADESRPVRPSTEQRMGGHRQPTIITSTSSSPKIHSGIYIYDEYYAATVNALLKPFFFASIGFSIPITQMFEGSIVWRGIVYALLMTLGKLLCGAWLVKFPSISTVPSRKLLAKVRTKISSAYTSLRFQFKSWSGRPQQATYEQSPTPAKPQDQQRDTNTPDAQGRAARPSLSPEPLSLYPAAILGSAMVTRGEIDFLISSIAEDRGIFDSGSGDTGAAASPLFLVTTWAIFICTFLGPVGVGLLVRRVQRLQSADGKRDSGKGDPLGIWGVPSIGTA